jgi:DNA-binding response OmpR family regulator
MHKILTIDDDKNFQEVYKLKLEKEGYEILQALNGKDGLIKAKGMKPDLILLDIMMPGNDGLNLLTLFKNDPQIQNIPIIMLTNVESEILDSFKSGAAWYFVKSNTSLEDLVGKIKSILV